MKLILLIITLAFFLNSCKVHTNFTQRGVDDIAGVYKVDMGVVNIYHIYIVDGQVVRRDIYPDFIFGGNEQRYPFIPHNEIWIDDAISIKEYQTTVIHEINEMNLMHNLEMTYLQAHDSALKIERIFRDTSRSNSEKHEQYLPEVSPTDTDSIKQIESLPDKIKLSNIYLQIIDVIDKKYGVWLVSGDKIRRDIYPDFGFNGDWYDYNFIPENEIWIDGYTSCSEYYFLLEEEKLSVKMLEEGEDYDEMKKKVSKEILKLRIQMYNKLADKFVKVDKNNLTNDKGKK
jgi:hypothetical protein